MLARSEWRGLSSNDYLIPLQLLDLILSHIFILKVIGRGNIVTIFNMFDE